MEFSNNSPDNLNVSEQIEIFTGSSNPVKVSIPLGDDEDCSSSSRSTSEETDNLMSAAMNDEVTAQLATAGPVGVAAATAIISTRKKRSRYSFETNPSIRKRQENRLLRKLKQTVNEYSTRIGQQAIVLVATPGEHNSCYKTFGAKPLEDVIQTLRSVITEELENALAHQAPSDIPDDDTLFTLPPLNVHGLPTPVENMTQAQLRNFIPLMIKYSTGRGKPGWGKAHMRPPWWPEELPWANVRTDSRSEDEKQNTSWSKALQQVVINCYKYHGREDLLSQMNFVNGDGEVNGTVEADDIPMINLYDSSWDGELKMPLDCMESPQVTTKGTPTVINSISNRDTLHFVQIDPNNPTITLLDGTRAHVQGMVSVVNNTDEEPISNHLVLQVISDQDEGETQWNSIPVKIENGTQEEFVDLNSVTSASLTFEEQSEEDEHVRGVITGQESASTC